MILKRERSRVFNFTVLTHRELWGDGMISSPILVLCMRNFYDNYSLFVTLLLLTHLFNCWLYVDLRTHARSIYTVIFLSNFAGLCHQVLAAEAAEIGRCYSTISSTKWWWTTISDTSSMTWEMFLFWTVEPPRKLRCATPICVTIYAQRVTQLKFQQIPAPSLWQWLVMCLV